MVMIRTGACYRYVYTSTRWCDYHSRRLTTLSSVVIKVGMVGDSQIGKTSLMVKYVEGSFDEDYIQTLGTCLLSSSRLPASTVLAMA